MKEQALEHMPNLRLGALHDKVQARALEFTLVIVDEIVQRLRRIT